MTLMQYCLAVKALLEQQKLKQIPGDLSLMRDCWSAGKTPQQALEKLKKRSGR